MSAEIGWSATEFWHKKRRTQLQLVCSTISFWSWKPNCTDRRDVSALMLHERRRIPNPGDARSGAKVSIETTSDVSRSAPS